MGLSRDDLLHLTGFDELKSDGEIYQHLFEPLKRHTTKGRPLCSVRSLEDFSLSLPLERMAGTAIVRLCMGSFGGLITP